jgi:hypothetical protein
VKSGTISNDWKCCYGLKFHTISKITPHTSGANGKRQEIKTKGRGLHSDFSSLATQLITMSNCGGVIIPPDMLQTK